MGTESPYMTQAEAAAYLRVSLTTFKARVRGAIPCHRIGAKPLFRRVDLDAYMTDHTHFTIAKPSRARGSAYNRARTDPKADRIAKEL